jgi:hypothetical protein
MGDSFLGRYLPATRRSGTFREHLSTKLVHDARGDAIDESDRDRELAPGPA